MKYFFVLNGQYTSSGTVPNTPPDYTTFDNLNIDTTTVAQTSGVPFNITGPSATKLATGLHFSNVTIAKAATPTLQGSHYSGLTTSNVLVNGAAFMPTAAAP